MYLRFYGTGLDEIVDTLHRYYLYLIYQCMSDSYTKFHFESGKEVHSLEITCSKSKLYVAKF